MKRLFFIIFILNCLFAQQARAQMYWEVAPWVFDLKKSDGIQLKLDNTNRLFIHTFNTTTIGNGTDFTAIIKRFFENFNTVKDSLKEDMAYKVYFRYNAQGKSALSVVPNKPKNKRFVVVNQKPMQVYENQNIIYIFPLQKESLTNVFEFWLNELTDLQQYEQSTLINDFIAKLNQEIEQKYPSAKPATTRKTYYNKDDFYPSRFNGEYAVKGNSINGSLKPASKKAGRYTLSPSVAANIQNYQNHFMPSFNAALSIYIKNDYPNSILRFGAYWEPMFLFGKNGNGGTKAYRNDFVGLVYESRNYKEGEKYNNQLTLYAPMSIAYLVHRSGAYFEQNTFLLGVGGVKYGAMTMRPFMYFNNVFKNVSPSIQLSIGFGR